MIEAYSAFTHVGTVLVIVVFETCPWGEAFVVLSHRDREVVYASRNPRGFPLVIVASRYPRGFLLVGNENEMKVLPESDSLGRPSRGAC